MRVRTTPSPVTKRKADARRPGHAARVAGRPAGPARPTAVIRRAAPHASARAVPDQSGAPSEDHAPSMRRRVGQAFTVSPQGRIVATKFDRIPRTMRFITPQGLIDLTLRDPRAASLNGRHMAAVHQALGPKGDPRALKAFRGKAIRVGKITYPFITDSKTLERLAFAGEVSFEDLYALTTGETK